MALTRRAAAALFATALLLLCVVAVTLLNGRAHPPLLETPQRMGPVAANLLQTGTLKICGSKRSGWCVYGSRMPAGPATLAVLTVLSRNHTTAAMLLKAIVFAVPLLGVFLVATYRAGDAPGIRSRYVTACAALLLFATALPPALNLVGNLSFEEGYFYSALALASALLFFPACFAFRPLLAAMLLVGCASLVYLTKSSMLPCAAVLLLLGGYALLRRRPVPLAAVAVLAVFPLVMLAWGVRQQHATGRFTTGTTLDWTNFYKGNNALLLQHYPALGPSGLDPYDALILPRVIAPTEWSMEDASKQLGLTYVRQHPLATAHAAAWKAYVLFVETRRNADVRFSPPIEWSFRLGLMLQHLLVAGAVLYALLQLRKGREDAFAALACLAVLGAVALPYVVGFALPRHATVMSLPAATYLCRWLRSAVAP